MPAEFRPRRPLKRLSRAQRFGLCFKPLAFRESLSDQYPQSRARFLARRRPQVICSWPERITKWAAPGNRKKATLRKTTLARDFAPLTNPAPVRPGNGPRNQLPPAASEFTKQQGRLEALCHNLATAAANSAKDVPVLMGSRALGRAFYRTHATTRTIVLKSTPPGASDFLAECLTVAQSVGSQRCSGQARRKAMS